MSYLGVDIEGVGDRKRILLEIIALLDRIGCDVIGAIRCLLRISEEIDEIINVYPRLDFVLIDPVAKIGCVDLLDGKMCIGEIIECTDECNYLTRHE